MCVMTAPRIHRPIFHFLLFAVLAIAGSMSTAVHAQQRPEHLLIAIAPSPAAENNPFPWEQPTILTPAWDSQGLPEEGTLIYRPYENRWDDFKRDWETLLTERPPAFVTGERTFLESLPGLTDEYQLLLSAPPSPQADAVLLARAGDIRTATDVILGTVVQESRTGGASQLEQLQNRGYQIRVAEHGRAVEALLHLAAGSTDYAAMPLRELNQLSEDRQYKRIVRSLDVVQEIVSGAEEAVYVRHSLLETRPEVVYAVAKLLHSLDETLQPQPLRW